MSSVEFLTLGRGPGLVVIPGSTRRAHHYRALAEALSDVHTVHVVNRRGRGGSPPQGPDYVLETEIADAIEVLDETGAEQVFGHSYGGLVGLHVALRRSLARLIGYEPSVSVDGSIALGWLDSYDRLLAEGRDATATIDFLSGMGFVPGGPVTTAAFWLMQRLSREGRLTRELLPTVSTELRQIAAMDSDGSRYAAIDTPTLLLGGGRSPAYLIEVLPLLAGTIPQAKLIITPEFDHNAPDLGAPAAVARLIRA